MSNSKGKILFQLTGSISVYKACTTISRLVQLGYEVQTACTANALNFIGQATLAGLTGRAVFTNTFDPQHMMDHIHLAKWADIAVVCPASANTINKLASGISDDVVGTLFLAYDLRNKPYIVAPAMNQEMYRHPATQASLEKLKSWNIDVLSTDEGWQACGDVGPGRLLDPEKIASHIVEKFGRP